MSSLLEQAIIDAKILQETAKKKAEASIIEKYEPEIKDAIRRLLEQEDALGADPAAADPAAGAMGGMPSADPMAGGEATPETQKFVKNIPASYLGEDNSQEIEINLDSIVEKIDSLQKDLNMSMPDFASPAHDVIPHANPTMIATDTLAEAEIDKEKANIDGKPGLSAYEKNRGQAIANAMADEDGEENEEDEEENINEADCLEEGDCMDEDQLDEELVLDLKNVSAGGIHANEVELRRQHDIAKALEAQNADLLEQLKTREEEFSALEEKLTSVFSSLKETKSKLNKSLSLNVQLKEGFEFLTKKVSDVNLLNARLLYTNKVLGNASLNERQKKQIAESISNSKTVEEAKTIYETLQRSAQVVVEKRSAPQSLTEAINRAPSAFLPRNNASSAIDPQMERWQRIAGIKK